MRLHTLALTGVLLVPAHGSPPPRAPLPTAAPNENWRPSGRLRAGVLTLSLEARLTMWHPDGDLLPGIPIEAFAERGRVPEVPGPLIRVPRDTELHIEVRNALQHDTLTFFLLGDSITVPPGE